MLFVPIMIKMCLTGGAVYGTLTVAENSKIKSKVTHSLTKIDNYYQKLIQKHFDPLFTTQKRNQQVVEFSGKYSKEEKAINRRLGLAVVNTGLAISGSVFSSPLLLISSGAMTLYIVTPILFRYVKIFVREKRIAYRLIGSASVLLNYLAGFYIIGSLILTVVFFAFKLAARTEEYARKSLVDIFELQPPSSVWILVNGVEIELPFSQLQAGDIIVLNAGQTVPVDGYIVQGTALVDQHILTGESQPIEKTLPDKVFASTLLLTGRLQICVEKTGSSTVAMQVGNILSNAANYHSSWVARSEQIADQTVLPILSLCSLAWLTLGSTSAVTIFNSGLGSILLFSGPLNMLSYLSIASHNGILVKDGRSLETLHTVDTVVFDKTGTLTSEQPEVVRVYTYSHWTESQVLTYAAIAEHRQSHPIAKAILHAATQRTLDYLPPDEANYEIGFGIRVICQDEVVHVGSARFMAQENIAVPTEILEQQQYCQQEGSSLVIVALKRQVVGAIELQAQLRPEVTTLISQLHKRGLKLCILSGDHTEPTRHLAKRLNIDNFFAEVLPEGKAKIIKELQQQGHKVCFVGDGINDAIALHQADVSISMSGATTIATDSASIVLVNHSLQMIEHLFDISNKFHANQNRSLLFAFAPGSILISGVFLFHFGMPAALVTYTVGLSAALGNALYPLLKFNQQKTTLDNQHTEGKYYNHDSQSNKR